MIFGLQGDVGGGHYYAYIRPNGTGAEGFDYEASADKGAGAQSVRSSGSSSGTAESKGEEGAVGDEERGGLGGLVRENLDKNARHGQWFKFNDETVLKVGHFAWCHCFLPLLLPSLK